MNLSFLSSSPSDLSVILQDKTLCLSELLIFWKALWTNLQKSVASAGLSIQMRQLELQETLQEKEEAPNITIASASSSEESRNLRLIKERLEENIVYFKLKVANLKSEIECLQDAKAQICGDIKAKDEQIQNLTCHANILKAEKHSLIVRHSQDHVSSETNLHKSSAQVLMRQSFDKNNIKPYPASSFQFVLSAESERVESLNASIADVRSTRSFWTEGSS